MEIPRKSDSPVIMRFLIQFILVNWRNDNPTEAANKQEIVINDINSMKTTENRTWIKVIHTDKAKENTI